MVITLEADYAVRIVDTLARAQGKVGARSIAEQTLVTQRFTLKILNELVTAGIVQSFKGAHGGYALARAPEQITLLQVLEAVEGPYMFSRCQEESYTCDHNCSVSCRYQEVYDEVTRMVRDKLASYTFAAAGPPLPEKRARTAGS